MNQKNFFVDCLHGRRGSNSRHLVLETSALPTELLPYVNPHLLGKGSTKIINLSVCLQFVKKIKTFLNRK